MSTIWVQSCIKKEFARWPYQYDAHTSITPCLVITIITDNMSHAVISTIIVILIMRFWVGLQGLLRSVNGCKLFFLCCTEERALTGRQLWTDKTSLART